MAKKIIETLYDPGESMLSKYKRIRVGDAGWLTWMAFECVTTLFGYLPGVLGLFLRSKLYRPFFKSIGRGVVFGEGVVIRNPGAIEIGNQVVIDDLAVLDAKGEGADKGIVLGDRVFISRNVLLGCKSGRIQIGSGVSIGPGSIVHSIEESRVVIGDYTVIAAHCYLIGAPNYRTDRIDVPMAQQGFEEGKGITIGDDVWLGASVVVLNGSVIQRGAIVGALALVRGELPAFAKAHGIPARVHGYRPGAGPPGEGRNPGTPGGE